jgi:ribonuclease T2
MLRPTTVLLLAALATLCCAHSALARRSSNGHSAHTKNAGTAGVYDYYVMSLSWSPTFCQTHRDEDEQCNHKGYGFVLHGLWPQYDKGRGPEHCPSTAEPDRKTVAEALAFMPSRRLVNHEWQTHGTCTGLGPDAYFALADRAFASVRVPPQLTAPARDVQMTADDVRGAFRQANPKLRDDMMNLHCSKGELVEVRICLDKDLAPRSCGKRMRTGCPVSASFRIPAAN